MAPHDKPTHVDPSGKCEPPGLLRSLPSPKRLPSNHKPKRTPALRQFEYFYGGFFRSVFRVLVCCLAAIRLVAAIVGDVLSRRNTAERRAKRLRLAIQSLGPTFIKLGQQLSARVDLIPYVYIAELERLLDDVPAFPFKEAASVIERTTGKTLGELFQTFDPTPIGSGSIACVYQAVLKNGDPVAVKVRRPGIGKQLAADLKVLRWSCLALELFVFPPGFTRNFIEDLRVMLFEELNFANEARYTQLFRKQVKHAKMKFVTAPKVYHALCSFELLVTEFVTGFWMTDVLHAVETEDQAVLDFLAEQKIKPKKLAERLLQTSRFGAFEGWFFHADFHPANILVRPGNKLTLIDFGSCGTSTEKERRVWRGFFHAQSESDVSGMVRAILGMLDPVPPIDLDEFAKKLEAEFWRDLHAHKSKHANWWERTTTNLWIGFFVLTRKYKIPVNINILKTIRASLLSHTIAARLYPKIDHYEQFRLYSAKAGKRARERVRQRLKGLTSDQAYITAEQALVATRAAFERFQRVLDTFLVNTTRLEKTSNYVVSEVMKAAGVGLVLAIPLHVIWAWVRSRDAGVSTSEALSRQFETWEGWQWVLTHPTFFIPFGVWVCFMLRRIMYRLGLKFAPAR